MKPEERQKLTFWTFFTAEVVFVLIAFVACFSLFLFFSREVFLYKNKAFDNAVFRWSAAHQSQAGTMFLEWITFFASKNFLFTVPPVIIIFLLFFKRWHWFATYIFVATFGSFVLNQYFKFAFGRERPTTAFYFQQGYSFPSGHAMIGTAFYGMLAYLIWMNVTNVLLRNGLVVALVVWELVIAYSRVYLNVHYASDVLAGLAAGFFWLLLSILLVRQLQFYSIQKRRNKGEEI